MLLVILTYISSLNWHDPKFSCGSWSKGTSPVLSRWSHFLWGPFRKSVSCPMRVFDTPACAIAVHHQHILEARRYCCFALLNLKFPLSKPNCFVFKHLDADSIHWKNKSKSCINIGIVSFRVAVYWLKPAGEMDSNHTLFWNLLFIVSHLRHSEQHCS